MSTSGNCRTCQFWDQRYNQHFNKEENLGNCLVMGALYDPDEDSVTIHVTDGEFSDSPLTDYGFVFTSAEFGCIGYRERCKPY
jgi:hypothetical protein